MKIVYGHLFHFVCVALLNLGFHPAMATLVRTDSELAGRLMMVGIHSTSPSALELRHLRDLRPGSYVLFSRNIKSEKQTKMLTISLQKLCAFVNSQRCLIGVDQEGGIVNRIPGREHFLSPRLLAEFNPLKAEQIANEVAQILVPLGINLNLAPVLDLQNKNGDSFLRTRSFGSDPHIVSSVGLSFSRGLLAAGVLPTAKHFPGLGSVSLDPHFYNSVSSSNNESQSKHLQPFIRYSNMQLPVIMMSNSVYPSLDPFQPAFHSKRIVTSLLRDQIGFQGLIISDDLHMVSAQVTGGVGESAVRALEAGVDVVMVSYSIKTQRLVHQAIINAIRSGRLNRSDLQLKVSRLEVAMQRAEFQSRRLASIPHETYLSFRSRDLERLNEAAFHTLLSKNNFDGTEIAFVLNPRLYHVLKKNFGSKVRLLKKNEQPPLSSTLIVDRASDSKVILSILRSTDQLTIINFAPSEFKVSPKSKRPKSIINVFGPHYQFLDVVFSFKPSEPMKSRHEVSANLE